MLELVKQRESERAGRSELEVVVFHLPFVDLVQLGDSSMRS